MLPEDGATGYCTRTSEGKNPYFIILIIVQYGTIPVCVYNNNTITENNLDTFDKFTRVHRFFNAK